MSCIFTFSYRTNLCITYFIFIILLFFGNNNKLLSFLWFIAYRKWHRKSRPLELGVIISGMKPTWLWRMGVGLGHGDGPMEPARRWRRGGGTGAEDGSPLGGKGGRSVCCRTNSTSFKSLMSKLLVSTKLIFDKTVSVFCVLYVYPINSFSFIMKKEIKNINVKLK